MVIVMLGAPGTGKGTVGQMLSKEFGIVHISSGEIFRSYIKKHRWNCKKNRRLYYKRRTCTRWVSNRVN